WMRKYKYEDRDGIMKDRKSEKIARSCRRVRHAFLVQKIFVDRKLFNFSGVAFWFFATPVMSFNSFRRFHYVPLAVGETVSGREHITILKDNAATKWLPTEIQNHRRLGPNVIRANIFAAGQ